MSMANMKDRYWELMSVATAYQPTDLCDNCGHCRDQHYLVTKGVSCNHCDCANPAAWRDAVWSPNVDQRKRK